ncbi:MAG: outer membrane protein assembly factor BamE [Ramlibacter sp.]|nr:outer membrane protein assembly factor BamE [Ramlibacter sp.]
MNAALKLLCAALAFLGLAACDPQHIKELEEGVATEADVRARFGVPENVWDGPGGERIFEYNRQPSGHKNYMISISPDGRMTALRQVLHPSNFGKVQAGMKMEDVRRLLGKPMKQTPYALKNEIAWDWRYMEPPNTSMVFTVWFNPDYRVLRTTTGPDPEAPEHRGGR